MWVAKIEAYSGTSTCIEVLETLHSWLTGLCWNGMYIVHFWLKTLIMLASPQQSN